jgi:hypothetical protein
MGVSRYQSSHSASMNSSGWGMVKGMPSGVAARKLGWVSGELDRLPAGTAAALALGATLSEQLELLKAAQQIGGEEGCH